MKKQTQIKVLSLLSYLFYPAALLWAIYDSITQKGLMKNSEAKFHFSQGTILAIVYFFAKGVIIFIGGVIPFLYPFLTTLLKLTAFIYILIGLWHVLNNEKKYLPIIGKWIKKLEQL